jgi:hypothetical protein
MGIRRRTRAGRTKETETALEALRQVELLAAEIVAVAKMQREDLLDAAAEATPAPTPAPIAAAPSAQPSAKAKPKAKAKAKKARKQLAHAGD